MVGQLAMNPPRFLAALAPGLLAFLAVLFVNLPVSFTGGVFPAPLLALIPIYYWATLRPDLMPPIAVLIVGVTEDLVSGGPPGIWAVGFLAAYALAERQREVLASLSGWAVTIGFAAAVFMASAAAYLLTSILFWRLVPLAPLLAQAVITVVFYPLAAPFLDWVHRRLIGPLRGDD